MLHEDCPYLGMGGHQGTWVKTEEGTFCSLCSERQAIKARKTVNKKESTNE